MPGDACCYLLEDIGEYARLTPQQGSTELIQYQQKYTGTARDCLRQWFGKDDQIEFEPVGLKRGEHHPFVWRNGISATQLEGSEAAHPRLRDEDVPLVRPMMLSFHRVQRLLLDVFETVTPSRENAAAHGAGIQNVLALAAFEIEALMGQAFRANCASQNSDRSDMGDWVALSKPMRLAEWETVLPYFPEWQWVRPFNQSNNNGVPSWWTAYNKLKHERSRRSRANLEAAVTATCAIRILLEAQFGSGIESLLIPAGPADIAISRRPNWRSDEVYFAPLRGRPLISVPIFP